MRPAPNVWDDIFLRLGFERRETIYRLAFADGAERCLWVRGRGADGLLAPVGAGYFDCATIPAPS